MANGKALNYCYNVVNEFIYRDTRDTKQHNSEAQVGLDAKYWYSQDATIPFDITFSMPPLDKRTRGYTPKQIKKLQETVGGDW